jgi:GT2 family glycosyltransferase
MLMHRDVVRTLGGFDVRYRLCADLDFWARAFALGAPFRYYGVTVAEFRLRAGQLSGDTALTRREMSRIVDRHFPAPIGPFHRKVARAGFRLRNLPRYFARWRARGWRTSYQLLQEAPG